jgi:thaumarchaeosortase
MSSIVQRIRENTSALLKFSPLVSFIVPILILYFYQTAAYPPYPKYYYLPTNSFEVTWKGRTFYLFFLWLASLELIINWERLQPYKISGFSLRTIALILSLLVPTAYVVVSNFCGLNLMITHWAWENHIAQVDWMALSTEYLVLGALFMLIVFLQYGVKGLKDSLLSPIFLLTIGVVYTIDNVYQYGSFTPFQILVPATATLAASVLNLMGFQTRWAGELYGTPVLSAWNSKSPPVSFGIAWPCSGIESLLIYTVTILLFLKNTSIPWKQRIIYFVIGAIVTFFINVLRIVTIFIIAINTGGWTVEAQRFHDYYGQLYSIVWIISYPLIIIAGRDLWGRIRTMRKNTPPSVESFKPDLTDKPLHR